MYTKAPLSKITSWLSLNCSVLNQCFLGSCMQNSWREGLGTSMQEWPVLQDILQAT